MNYPEDAAKAANYLRLAIPHLVKHEIPANPINYTIWYSYVAKRIPALNTALDRIIKYSGTCTPKQSQELYFNYIINEHLEEHGLSLSNFAYKLTDGGNRLSYEMMVYTSDSLNFRKIAKSLLAVDVLQDFSLRPLGD